MALRYLKIYKKAFGNLTFCTDMKSYIHDTLGPVMIDIQNFVSDCSKETCNGNGRCILKVKSERQAVKL